jgi:large subunit ribosomal protein L6
MLMEKIVSIPDGVSVEIKDLTVKVKGPLGDLERNFASPLFKEKIKLMAVQKAIKVLTPEHRRKIKSEVGCIAAHIRNMIKGVSHGWTYKLKIVYLHFPMSVKVVGKEVVISNFLGERAPRRALIMGDAKVEIKGDEITVRGLNIEDVGQTAANLERATWIPARDRRVFQDGIFLVSKE